MLNFFISNGGCFSLKMLSYHYKKSYCGDKATLQLPYIHNEISYTSKTASLYWNKAQQVYFDSKSSAYFANGREIVVKI